MGADIYIGTSGVDFEFGTYIEMKGKGGNDNLGSDAAVFAKIYGNGGHDFLYYVGPDDSKILGGNGNDKLLGGLQNDKLFGGKGNDTIFGSLGNDILKGNGGRDHFSFATEPDSKTNKDKILDFELNKDLIHFGTGVYLAFDYTGTIKKKNFEKGKKADDGDDYLGYHKNSGTIWYDPNGNDPGGKEKVACVDEGLNLTYKHFILD